MLWVLNAEHSFNNTDNFKYLCVGQKTGAQQRKFYEGSYSASEIRSTGELKWEVAGAEQVLKYLTTLLDEESSSS